jgi:hypothetical protein
MTRIDLEANGARILAWGSFLTTIMVTSWMSTEPVNYIKMLLITVTSSALLASLIAPTFRHSLLKNKNLYLMVATFVLVTVLSSIFSSDPFHQNFFGVFGRNTGLLTYVSLSLLFLAGIQFTQVGSFMKIIRFFLYALAVNVIYCLMVILGYDILPWNNVFGVPLGTFGNPNFIGAFLGFGFTAIFALILDQKISLAKKALLFVILLLIFFEIIKTNAVQGIVVSAIGFFFVLWVFLRSKLQNRVLEYLYIGFLSIAGMISVLGALQIGPLTSLIYKSSVSLRGIYWNAGLRTGLENFWLGAGMDSYGSWFRRSRDIVKLGGDTVTNSAHNVYIDIFSSGGIFLLVAYVFITFYVLNKVVRHLLKHRDFDPIFVILTSIWICYQAQSLISINQIGLAVWGWVFGGLIVGYTNLEKPELSKSDEKKRKTTPFKGDRVVEISGGTVLLSIFGGLLGAAIASPPFLADSNWRNAIQSKDSVIVEQALFRWPTDPVRISSGLRMFLQNEMYDKAYEVAKFSTKNFPNDYYSWYNLGILPNISPEEKLEIDMQLARLDPDNPKRPW